MNEYLIQNGLSQKEIYWPISMKKKNTNPQHKTAEVLLQAQLDPGTQEILTDLIFSHSISCFGFLHVSSIFRQPLRLSE